MIMLKELLEKYVAENENGKKYAVAIDSDSFYYLLPERIVSAYREQNVRIDLEDLEKVIQDITQHPDFNALINAEIEDEKSKGYEEKTIVNWRSLNIASILGIQSGPKAKRFDGGGS